MFFRKHRQDNLIIFSTDKNTIKDLAPQLAKANRGVPGERKRKEIWKSLFRKKKIDEEETCCI